MTKYYNIVMVIKYNKYEFLYQNKLIVYLFN